LWLSILGGLALGKTNTFKISLVYGFLSLIYISKSKRQNWLALLCAGIIGLSIGTWRGSIYHNRLNVYQSYYTKRVTLMVRASEDATYDQHKQLAFNAEKVTLANGEVLPGKVQVSGFGANAIMQNDEVEVSGKLSPGFGVYQAKIGFAKLEVIAHHPTMISEIRRRFVAGMQSALPEPLAPFAMGLLVGQRATLPDGVKQDLLMVGLTHIIAVSGYNLTIILQASRRLLRHKSKRLSTFLSVVLIGIFLLLAGASASIVRAAIVSMLSIVTAYYGRAMKSLNLICLAAVITAWSNPVYLWSDLSWYLSFLAFFGVMVLSPLVQARLRGNWHNSVLGAVALESVCAEIMTLPFVLHIFGQMSRIGLVANVMVVTLVPLAMLLGLTAGLAGMLSASIAGWLSWPAVLLLNYMLDLAHLLAGLPHVFAQGIGLSLIQMLGLYVGIALTCLSLWYKSRKSAIITEMNQLKNRSLLA
jgi:competence protein ComEC